MTMTKASQGTLMVVGNSGVTNARRACLFDAFARGLEVAIRDNRNGLYVRGHIQGIALESGYTPPAAPEHFLVDIRAVQASPYPYTTGTTYQVYVRTID